MVPFMSQVMQQVTLVWIIKYMDTMHTKPLSHRLESTNPQLGFDYFPMCPFSEATLHWGILARSYEVTIFISDQDWDLCAVGK